MTSLLWTLVVVMRELAAAGMGGKPEILLPALLRTW
eukprot:CAMPEP_0113677990 /NCGR_PEP_ID=MMETSP0038_2-20120614/9638_1 /TAXON_ID=2898 /ORGANISM="Cryptomonas paramecium" /LENGTH=35 /DNA_ID=CAMNT_0000595457 /DNA_START=514 /DNA_END=618 /DNA_ORIENTATION=+ /assembly_acc=CAM_ASM_000170